MSVNSTFADTPRFFFNSSLPPPDCLTFATSTLIFRTFSITNILFILPLSSLILYLGYQRWRQQRYISTAAAATSHSDIFTYHMLVMEMIAVLGCLFYYVGVNANHKNMIIYGFFTFLSPWSIKIHFYTLTCVEHYLAVVHPVTYLGLKNKGGIRIRNISIGCVWLMCFAWWMLVSQTPFVFSIIFHICVVTLDLIVICFCCISVLLALRRPGPGEVVGESERIDQTKRKSFNTVVTIMAMLLLCLGGMLVCSTLVNSQLLSIGDGCDVIMSSTWFSLPSSLVLPLLYLQRAGKLPGCTQSAK